MTNSLIFGLWLWLAGMPLAYSLPNPDAGDGTTLHGPKVRTGGATFIGNTEDSYGVDQWLGIRYAKPPIGSLRLQPPKKADNDGTVNAQSFGAQCFQMEPDANATLSEDCLTLNIYRPSKAAMKSIDKHYHSTHLPVMFWIHGGGFNDGSGSIYHSESLVNTSVMLKTPTIVVTINYRLSFFGFSAGKDVIANNALNLGLLDQRLALQWVQDNIKAFGGDPEKVTIFGQSAGGASVALQVTAYSGRHQDLFRAAILESEYSSPTPPATWPAYQTAWDLVVADVGCTNSSNVFKCVQAIPEQQLFTTVLAVGTTQSPLPTDTFPWQPVVDGTFLADLPSRLLAAGKFVKVPTIAGFTTDELTYVIPTSLNISTDLDVIRLALFVLPYVPLTTIETVLALDPLSAYPNIYGVGGVQWKRVTEIASDIFERCPGRAYIRNVTKFSPAWKYRWNAALPAQLAFAPEEGIVHAAEIPYVFGPSITPYINQPADLALSLVVQKAWISFATHLDPNALGDLTLGVSWPRYSDDTEQVLVFQKPDGISAPLGQGLHTEKDPDDRPACDFIVAVGEQIFH